MHGIIGMSDYVAVNDGHAARHLTWNADGRFVDMTSGADATELAKSYSRAKHGSIEDIRRLAGVIVSMLERELLDPSSDWRCLFQHARAHGESVVMLTTGWRNVPSTSNVLFGIALEHINVLLAELDLPTIIDVKLPRIAPPCENYPSLSTLERQRVSATQDHVIPGPNFYRWSSVHVIFGDDVLVTGSTADKVFAESMKSGARSCRSLYPIALDPSVALHEPTIEERINTSEVSGELNEVVADFLAHRDNVPILRALRLVFSASNSHALPSFLRRVPATNVLNLYVSALGNEFQREAACTESLAIVRQHLAACGLLNERGIPRPPWGESQ
ncbi:phosphoribosyltransferase family protein [Hydrogenophaga flava]|uniref:phosphoribosyltransferase family protein n=1 Tax=Hydrogenophaga flava TaxID=65657 RepID=UPI001C3F1FA6|nr:phosphoribosyltransferase family protein [Hydrogenophaga flava]